MPRNFTKSETYPHGFLSAFQQYASFGEAPAKMYFWVGVSTIAGALRRKVWIDQQYFKWFPNFYTILVAPPGVVAKTTTADIGMDLLREVPGIHFGPSVVTWPALVKSFAENAEMFQIGEDYHPMSAMTISSGEFGNLLNPQDKEMVDMLVNLWDGKSFKKVTKHSGSDDVINPWINLIACTTPAWIAGNFPEYMIGGGFTSRCVFVYAEKKARYVAYPGLAVPKDIGAFKQLLVQDLEHIATKLAGPYVLSAEAVEWGQEWYFKHNTTRQPHLDDARFGGYLARKQTHLHKAAMILQASMTDSMVITRANLELAAVMVTDLENEMAKVFKKIGMSDVAAATDRLLDFIKRRMKVKYSEAFRYIHNSFPGFRDFEDIVKGLYTSGLVRMHQVGTEYEMEYVYQDGEMPPGDEKPEIKA